jgi:small GTP-binding protein
VKARILTETEEAILATERSWLTRLQVTMAQFPASEEDRAALERSVRQLDELFLIVLVGEFNAGKSALINALFGESLLETGVTPTTTRIHLLKHGKETSRVAVDPDVDIVAVPAPLLDEITIVDTPGTNAIYREHEAMTREFLPRSDLVLFVTSVDRPFTESERAFLALIREWGKKVVIVLNKIDILEEPDDLAAIERFIRKSAQQLLGFTPEVLPVSARLALKAKQTAAEALLSESHIEELETYIVDRLDERERVRLKLLNPVRVGLHLTNKYLAVIDNRLGLLQDDFAIIDNVTQQLRTYQTEMAREFRLRLSDVDRELQAFENRGTAFFDETMRLAHFFDLLDRNEIEMQFREQAIADTPEAIETRVEKITAWLVARNRGLWRMMMKRVQQRERAHADRVLGDIPTIFDRDRKRVIESVGIAARQALQTYDQRDEAHRIAQSLHSAVAGTALVEIGAIGLGTLITVLASTTVLDVTGILAASTMAILGFLVIPSRRRRLKNELREKIAEVRRTLMETLTTQFETEVARSVREIEAAISPYTRFIRSQQTHWNETRDEMATIKKWLRRQETEIETLQEPPG